MSLSLLVLAACETPFAPNDPYETAADDRTPVSTTLGTTLTAEGTGTEGSWSGYRRADNSCTNTGGSYAVDCAFDFTLAQAADGTLTLAVVAYDPSHDWQDEDLIDVLRAGTIAIGTDGTPAATHLSQSGGYVWDVEAQIAGDTLSIEASGEYSNLSRCSGERVRMYCDATYKDEGLVPLVSPTLTLADLAPGDLAVHEVLADPTACSDSHAEWIEVRNDAGSEIDLTGLVVADASGNRSTLAGGLLLEAGGLAVLGRGGLSSFCDASVGPDAGMDGSISLNNSGDSVVLYAGTTVLDRVDYGTVAGGVAYALGDDGSWCFGAPTPGQANPSCVVEEEEEPPAEVGGGDLQVTALMMNPAACSDDGGEWIEVTNVSASALDLSGLELRDAAGTTGRISTSLVLAPGEAAWLGRGSSSSWAGATTPDAWYGSSPALNNDGDELTISLGGVELDHTPNLDPTAGASWQRDPATGVWCTATQAYAGGDLGTPGLTNPSCP